MPHGEISDAIYTKPSSVGCLYSLFVFRSAQGIGDLILPVVRDEATHVYHLYVVRTARRDALRDYLGSKGVQTGIHYPTALPMLEAYQHLGHTPADFPVASQNQREILSLPIFPELSSDALEYTVACIRDFFDSAQ